MTVRMLRLIMSDQHIYTTHRMNRLSYLRARKGKKERIGGEVTKPTTNECFCSRLQFMTQTEK